MPETLGRVVSEDGNTWTTSESAKPFYTSQGAMSAMEKIELRLKTLRESSDVDEGEIENLEIQLRRLQLEKELAKIVKL